MALPGPLYAKPTATATVAAAYPDSTFRLLFDDLSVYDRAPGDAIVTLNKVFYLRDYLPGQPFRKLGSYRGKDLVCTPSIEGAARAAGLGAAVALVAAGAALLT